MVFSSLNMQTCFRSTLGIDVRSRASYLHVHQTREERWPWQLLQGHPALHEGRSHFPRALGRRLQADHRLGNGRAPPGHLCAGRFSMNQNEEKFSIDPQALWAFCQSVNTAKPYKSLSSSFVPIASSSSLSSSSSSSSAPSSSLSLLFLSPWYNCEGCLGFMNQFLSFLRYRHPISSFIIDSFVCACQMVSAQRKHSSFKTVIEFKTA